jgi:galactokinase
MTAEVTTAWRKQTGRSDLNLAAMMQSPTYTPQELSRILSVEHSADELPHYTRRIEHFVAEDQKFVPAAIEALTKGDITTFGNIVNLSHDFGDTHLDNQIPETRTLVKLARELGAVGSSAFGAGFGGSAYAVIRESESERFCEAWKAAYSRACPAARGGEFFTCHPSAAAFEIG